MIACLKNNSFYSMYFMFKWPWEVLACFNLKRSFGGASKGVRDFHLKMTVYCFQLYSSRLDPIKVDHLLGTHHGKLYIVGSVTFVPRRIPRAGYAFHRTNNGGLVSTTYCATPSQHVCVSRGRTCPDFKSNRYKYDNILRTKHVFNRSFFSFKSLLFWVNLPFFLFS